MFARGLFHDKMEEWMGSSVMFGMPRSLSLPHRYVEIKTRDE